MVRGAVLVLLLAGCSPKSAAPSDLSTCTFVFSGDASGTEACDPRLCDLPTSDTLLVHTVTGRAETDFTVDGRFTPGRSYAAADLNPQKRTIRSLRAPQLAPTVHHHGTAETEGVP